MMFVVWVVAILVTLTIHEFAHAASAYFYGDDTAKSLGRLSLNPIPHIDILGFLMLLFAGFGWAKPVPVNPYRLKNPRVAMGMISAAGPASNLLMVVIFGILFKIFFSGFSAGLVLAQTFGGINIYANINLLAVFFALLIFVNVILMIFNLIPIPPLDGSKVLFSILPDRFNEFKHKLSINGPWILLILILADNFLNIGVFSVLFGWVFQIMGTFL